MIWNDWIELTTLRPKMIDIRVDYSGVIILVVVKEIDT
jgi:hypothetical protein